MGASSPDRSLPVVFVHGLWMHGLTMSLLARQVRDRGYTTLSYSYPTVRVGLDDNARRLAAFLARRTPHGAHLVGHSMGGVVILRMLACCPHPPVQRCVLLGSPIQGSALAARLRRNALMARVIGLSIADWLNHGPCAAPAGSEIGVIAGTRCLAAARIFGGIERPNDGVVSVAETRLPGEQDRRVLHVGHSEMLLSRRVGREIATFLDSGRFAASSLSAGRESAG
ncbi:MAG: alpha/beta hydrolase [Rhodocyclaceae bacterium]|nr:alpha/beta hydrolase [Rhodocyclaceae bacterium]